MGNATKDLLSSTAALRLPTDVPVMKDYAEEFIEAMTKAMVQLGQSYGPHFKPKASDFKPILGDAIAKRFTSREISLMTEEAVKRAVKALGG